MLYKKFLKVIIWLFWSLYNPLFHISLSISPWTHWNIYVYGHVCTYILNSQMLCAIFIYLDATEHLSILFTFQSFVSPNVPIFWLSQENTKENHVNRMIFFFFFETISDLTNKIHEKHWSIEDDYLKNNENTQYFLSLSHTHSILLKNSIKFSGIKLKD